MKDPRARVRFHSIVHDLSGTELRSLTDSLTTALADAGRWGQDCDEIGWALRATLTERLGRDMAQLGAV